MIMVHGVKVELASYSQPAQPPLEWVWQALQQEVGEEAWA
jgi:hypothetical protein